MKKIILLIILLLTLKNYCQNTNDGSNLKNEIKLDVFDLAIFTAIDVGYERIIKKEMSFGLSVFINFKAEETYYEKFAVTPFYRFYFFDNTSKGNSGYYFEFFSKFASGTNLESINPINTDKNYFDVNLGGAIGQKWISNDGFILEIYIGGGRNLGFSKNSPDFAFRGGISLGYRF